MLSFFQQIDPKKLLDRSYLFETNPEAKSSYIYLTIIFLVFIIISILLPILMVKRKISPPHEKLQKKFSNLLLFSGLIGLCLVFFRWQGLAYIGSRFVMFLLFVGFLIWLINILQYRFFTFPKEINKINEKRNFEKYLPSSKKVLNER